MMLYEYFALMAFIAMLLGAFLLSLNAEKGGLCAVLVGVVLGLAAVIIQECRDRTVPTALDVYRGKTTLEITYRDSVAIDSTVVYKVR
jgi:hypothetical protein